MEDKTRTERFAIKGGTMTRITKNVSIMCFHDELCQVYNALMTALSLLREGSKVTIFFGSRGINAVHKDKVKELKCMPDAPKELSDTVMKKMEEMELPTVEDLFIMLIAEKATVLACPLNISLFGMTSSDLIEDVKVADPAKYYKEVVIQADMNLTF
jgi:peroxiredoxin family protein